MSGNDITAVLQSNRLADKVKLVQRLLDADRRGFCPIAPEDRKALKEFLLLARHGRTPSGAVLLVLERLAREYRQHLVALASGR